MMPVVGSIPLPLSIGAPEIEVVIAPSFICLAQLAVHVKELGLVRVSLAAQDVSPFPKGGYTGAIAADMVRGLADYVMAA